MVSPKTRGIRGRGTLLKRKAVKEASGGIIALICVLFTIGLTLDGLSISTLFSQPFNLLSIIGLFAGSTAIVASIKFWREGTKLQRYWKPKKKRFKFLSRKKKKKQKKEKKEKEKKEKQKKPSKSKSKKK